jgi:DNA-binding NarL/FixJ family response regulator
MPSPGKLKVFIVDDHFLIPQGISMLLSNEPDFEISGISNKPADVVELLEKTPSDILITDISMPVMSGVELTAQVLKKFPHMRVLALSMFSDLKMINGMIEAGIRGYVLKDTSKEELVLALNTIADGGQYFSENVQLELKKEDTSVKFTGREVEIIKLISEKYNSRQIAEKLYISERTVESHRSNMLRKTSAGTIIGLLQYAYQNNII